MRLADQPVAAMRRSRTSPVMVEASVFPSMADLLSVSGVAEQLAGREDLDESEMMAKALVGMTMSLDGFVQDRHGRIDRLHPNLAALQTETLQELIRATGAVVMGRRVYDGNAHHGALGASKPSRHS